MMTKTQLLSFCMFVFMQIAIFVEWIYIYVSPLTSYLFLIHSITLSSITYSTCLFRDVNAGIVFQRDPYTF